jgi:hypothetical protein
MVWFGRNITQYHGGYPQMLESVASRLVTTSILRSWWSGPGLSCAIGHWMGLLCGHTLAKDWLTVQERHFIMIGSRKTASIWAHGGLISNSGCTKPSGNTVTTIQSINVTLLILTDKPLWITLWALRPCNSNITTSSNCHWQTGWKPHDGWIKTIGVILWFGTSKGDGSSIMQMRDSMMVPRLGYLWSPQVRHPFWKPTDKEETRERSNGRGQTGTRLWMLSLQCYTQTVSQESQASHCVI